MPGENPSTEATRREGTNHMRNFFMDSRYSKYPPSSMVIEDITDYCTPLDHVVVDRDVLNIINFIFDEDTLNENFARNFSSHAKYIFGGPRYPEEAVTRFGYGLPNPNNGQGRAYAPGFVPPANDNNEIANSEDVAGEEKQSGETTSTNNAGISTSNSTDHDVFEERESSEQVEDNSMSNNMDTGTDELEVVEDPEANNATNTNKKRSVSAELLLTEEVNNGKKKKSSDYASNNNGKDGDEKSEAHISSKDAQENESKPPARRSTRASSQKKDDSFPIGHTEEV